MADTRLQILITAKEELSKSLGKANKTLKEFDKETKKVSKSSDKAARSFKSMQSPLSGVAKQLTGVVGGLFAVGGAIRVIGNLTDKYIDFEKEMRRVNTITRLQGQGFEKMKDDILDLTKIVPFTAKELSTAMFDIASAGVSANNQLAFLGQASQMAAAGVLDVQTAVQGLTAVMKGYGLAEADALYISDLFFKANELGQTTVGEMANSIQELTANANASGVSVEELLNVYATFTGVTGNASRVTTQMKGALNAIVKPTKEVRNIIDEYNKTAGENAVILGRNAFETQNLAEISRSLIKAVDGDQEALRRLIPEVEAANLIIAAGTVQFDEFNRKLGEMQNATGSTGVAFAEMQKSMANQLQLARQELEYFGFRTGEVTSFIKLSIFKFLNSMVDAISIFIGAIKLAGKSIAIIFASIFTGLTSFMGKSVNKALDGINWFIKQGNKLGNKVRKAMGLDERGPVGLLKFKIDTEGLDEGLLNTLENMGRSAKGEFDKLRGILSGTGGDTVKFAAFQDLQKSMEETTEKGKERFSGFEEDITDKAESVGKALKNLSGKYLDLRDDSIKTLLKLKISHDESINKITEKLRELNLEYGTLELEGKRAISNLKDANVSSLKNITRSIEDTKASIEELNAEFSRVKAGDIQNLAQAFINAESKISDLRLQIRRSTDAQEIANLKEKVRKEEAALAKTTEVQSQFAKEIEEARRRAGLSDIERAIEDYNIKRDLAQKEHSARQSALQSELSSLRSKFEFEKIAGEDKVKRLESEIAMKLAGITKEKEALVKQKEEEVKLYESKLATINGMIELAETMRREQTDITFDNTKDKIESEINLYGRLASAMREAASARSLSLVPGVPDRGGRQLGGEIYSTGNYLLHKGEYVVPNKNQMGGGTVVNINGGTYLSEDAAEQIGDMIINRLKSNVRI